MVQFGHKLATCATLVLTRVPYFAVGLFFAFSPLSAAKLPTINNRPRPQAISNTTPNNKRPVIHGSLNN
ncbi:hypothetical protein N3K66_008235 [Trichothecium roseum]|uniref:Uncharacterized protein n=1 Tax=Trichothecium roseum TaxID=47278 RepID=A0ACC0USX7_9HYPO|nr:hypothetical protein N3K66_008235 [Trichothecium roseum]